jgi:DNA-directed RNA polymerase subunit H (RpoH/RPB5)
MTIERNKLIEFMENILNSNINQLPKISMDDPIIKEHILKIENCIKLLQEIK